ncbi:MAG: glycoside hydrolase family 3 C-terminal domain-containing protein, partial [Clostridia bacterium]|nr:glycoside hydrolase family 3 C-terminal domain-containing protein [Clostridia bacterium]
LYFCGLTDDCESEGCDREDMRLPEKQLIELDALLASGKPVAVVLFGGSPVELPFHDRVSAILNMYLPGQNGGTAAYELLFGEKNPSGKLAETWPLRYEDVPSHRTFGRSVNEVYSEGTEVGYRYYNKHNVPVRFPFGFGLSYTTFEKTEWTRVGDAYEQTITNTGSLYGGEVAQLYVDGELAGFKKVYLEPGESAAVRIVPEPKDENVYSDELVITPEPPRFPVTLESRFTDLEQTFTGRILYNSVLKVVKKNMKQAEKLPEGPERDNAVKGAFFMKRVMDSNSPRSLTMCAGKRMPYNYAQGFVELTNRHLIKGLRCFIKKIDVPKLPKEE